MLKKQTIWLLTMLSLVVVLSVYYVTSPTDQALPFMPEEGAVIGDSGEEWVVQDDLEIEAEAVDEQLFDVLRMEVQDERNALKEQLTTKVASADYSTDEKNEAYNELEALTKVQAKEVMMETMIKSMGYDDAFVRADEDRILITVKSDEHSKEAANPIIQLAKKELGDERIVAVEFQSDSTQEETEE